ncbi:RHS repeat-associated core domain-containing protein [bacterium AH-315-J04]|nr:RHS repeat-associated core domain-containing protein [bacterium AH-315-J04]
MTYHYDVDVAQAGVLEGKNNRLIYYSTDSTLGGTTSPISTTYYDYTNEGNPDRIITELANPATGSPGEPRFAATRFGYAKNGEAVTYMLGETWNTGTSGNCVNDYTITYAREFRYDGSRRRYLNRELDPVALQNDNQYIELPTTSVWSDYVGNNVYSDYEVHFGADQNANPPEPLFTDLAMYQPGIGHVTGLDTPFPDSSYYVTNHLGTTMNRFGKDNAIAASQATYSAFGERIDPGTHERYGYAGAWGYQQHNTFEYTGSGEQMPNATKHMAFQFSHVGARYYDPAVGRFMQRDPIGVSGGLNVYEYVGNIPTLHVDPSGELAPILIAGGIAAGVKAWETIVNIRNAALLVDDKNPNYEPTVDNLIDDLDRTRKIKQFKSAASCLARKTPGTSLTGTPTPPRDVARGLLTVGAGAAGQ